MSVIPVNRGLGVVGRGRIEQLNKITKSAILIFLITLNMVCYLKTFYPLFFKLLYINTMKKVFVSDGEFY